MSVKEVKINELKIEELDVSGYADYAGHEKVLHCTDEASGLNAIIAIHNTNLGPAAGGCRMRQYASFEDAVTDVLRLSRGMTYKSAIAGLPMGGGKSVIIGDPATDKSEALLLAMGRFVDSLGGQYITAEDVGMGVEDLQIMARETEHVTGYHQKAKAGQISSGDPSPITAAGVLEGIKAAYKYKTGDSSLLGVRIAVQGVGHVGANLVRQLVAEGADLIIADVNHQAVNALVDELDIRSVPSETILEQEVDILAPCAMGGVINENTLKQIKAGIIAGAANNQLLKPEVGQLLRERGILYAPDYVINAGGIIDVHFERTGYDYDQVMERIHKIGETLMHIFEQADKKNVPTQQIADEVAEGIFLKKGGPGGFGTVANF
ncbi:MAG: amino acid dehydrogenase [Gammaproteobacteria bacterium]|nr:amino acid dehydrogenase [Gammaproteobacteria bacterium]